MRIITDYITVVDSSPFSKVFKIAYKSTPFYLKIFNKSPNYYLNNYDLSDVFSRNRIVASDFFYKKFKENIQLKKYISKFSKTNSFFRILLTRANAANEVKLSNLIMNKRLTHTLVSNIYIFSKDLIENPIKVIPPTLLQNNKVLRLKKELQFRKPLIYLFGENKTDILIQKLLDGEYLNHGDLQPKNLLVSENQLTMIDFEEGFIGLPGWDLGFLWGNLFYSLVGNKQVFDLLFENWSKLLSLDASKRLKLNITLFCTSTILMRIKEFPIFSLNAQEEKSLIRFVNKLINLYEI